MRLSTARLRLDPLRVEDAAEMVEVLADEQLYDFIGGQPSTLAELAERYRRLVEGRSAGGNEEWHNWIVRLRGDGRAVGTVQATIFRQQAHADEQARADEQAHADIAWVIGVPWQGQGLASEAARELVRWLESRGVTTITAHVYPNHEVSARVASRAGLSPTGEIEDGEQIWRRRADKPRPNEDL